MIKTWQENWHRGDTPNLESRIDCMQAEIDELRAALLECDAELGDLPQAQAEMLTTIKVQRKVLEQALRAMTPVSGYGRIGTEDSEQAMLQAAITAIQRVLK